MMTIAKSSTLAAAVLALGMAALPMQSAEARWRGGYGGAVAAGIVGGALLGGALLAPRYGYGYGGYAAPVYGGPVYVDEGPRCYIVRERVFDDYRGRWIRVRRQVCD